MAKANTAVICLSPYAGGMEMDAIKMAQLLRYDTNVVLIAKEGCFIHRYYNAYLRDSEIEFKRIRFRWGFSPSIIVMARAIVANYHIKNVIFFGASELSSLFFAFLNQDINLIIRHGATKTTSKKDWFHRLIYRDVKFHVAICRHQGENIEDIIPLTSPEQLKIIYPSLWQDPVLGNRSHKDNVIRLLHVGRVTDGKGQMEAIEACGILHEQGYEFELNCVGEIDPEYEDEIFGVIATRPYASSINMVGYTDDVTPYYQNADIFIFPRKGDDLSNAFIEALGYGMICICFENTSFPELRELGFTFFMAKDQDLADLRQNLLEAVEKLQVTHLPIKLQSDLACEIFSPTREKTEYLSLLQ